MKKALPLLALIILLSGCSVTGKAVSEVRNETSSGVVILSLVDPLCSECGNNMVHYQRLRSLRVYVNEFKNLNYRTDEGQRLVKKYNITKVPTVIIENLSLFREAWGFYNMYGDYYGNIYVFRKPEIIPGFPYRNLLTNKIEKTIQVLSEVFRGFKKTTEQLCYEGGKPVVYFFSDNEWENAMINKAMIPFMDKIKFYANSNYELYLNYPGNSNTKIIFGCMYYREGLPEEFNEDKETETLTVMACRITGGSPIETCSRVSNLLQQIS